MPVVVVDISLASSGCCLAWIGWSTEAPTAASIAWKATPFLLSLPPSLSLKHRREAWCRRGVGGPGRAGAVGPRRSCTDGQGDGGAPARARPGCGCGRGARVAPGAGRLRRSVARAGLASHTRRAWASSLESPPSHHPTSFLRGVTAGGAPPSFRVLFFLKKNYLPSAHWPALGKV